MERIIMYQSVGELFASNRELYDLLNNYQIFRDDNIL